MREVNAAWAVLRNPAARARYDAELSEMAAARDAVTRGPAGTGEAARRARGAAIRDQWVPPPAAELEPDDGASSATGGRHRRFGGFGPLLVLGAVLVLILVFTAYAGPGEQSPPPQVQTSDQFPRGSCVVQAFGPDLAETDPGAQARPVVVAVPCSTPGAATVVGRAPLPQPCPADTRAWLLPESRESLCVRLPG